MGISYVKTKQLIERLSIPSEWCHPIQFGIYLEMMYI